MTRRIETKTDNALADEAEACYLALLDDDVEPGQRQRWLDWLSVEEHQRAFDDVVRLWEMLDYIGPVDVPSHEQLAADHYSAGAPLARGETQTGHLVPRRTRSGIAYGAAALVAALIAAVFFGTGFDRWRDPHQRQHFETRVGEIVNVRLPDASTVTLAGDSALEIDFSAGRRALKLLRGRALFDVARDAGRPFVVRAGTGSTTALGTRFDVNDVDGNVTVTLIHGLVRVTGDGDAQVTDATRVDPTTTLLGPGEQVSYTAQRRVGRIAAVDTDKVVSWRKGVLTFIDRPLAQAIEEVNRYRARRIYFRPAELAGQTVSGTVHLDRTDEWLQAIARGYALHIVEGGDGILLTNHAAADAERAQK